MYCNTCVIYNAMHNIYVANIRSDPHFSQEPNIDTCLMSKIKFYDVNISSDNGKSVSMETNSNVIKFLSSEHLNNKSNISYIIITIVVYNSEEMSSQPTTKNFGKQIAN